MPSRHLYLHISPPRVFNAHTHTHTRSKQWFLARWIISRSSPVTRCSISVTWVLWYCRSRLSLGPSQVGWGPEVSMYFITTTNPNDFRNVYYKVRRNMMTDVRWQHLRRVQRLSYALSAEALPSSGSKKIVFSPNSYVSSSIELYANGHLKFFWRVVFFGPCGLVYITDVSEIWRQKALKTSATLASKL